MRSWSRSFDINYKYFNIFLDITSKSEETCNELLEMGLWRHSQVFSQTFCCEQF